MNQRVGQGVAWGKWLSLHCSDILRMPNVCAYKSSTEGRVLISQVYIFLFAQTLITHSQGPGLAWWRQTMEVVTETIEMQPKFMGQVPCAPLKSVCEAGAPQTFLYVSIPSTFSSLIA